MGAFGNRLLCIRGVRMEPNQLPSPLKIGFATADGKSVCTATCTQCGSEVAIIEARSEASLRSRSLTLSSVVTVGLLSAYVWFAYVGKTLIIPDIVWAISLSPWLGAGTAEIIEFIKTRK